MGVRVVGGWWAWGVLPRGVLEVILRIPLEVGHLRAERLLLLRRVRVIILEEGDGEGDLRVRGVPAKGFVAGLDVLARVHVIPRDVLANQVAELPHREVPRILVPGGDVAIETHEGVQQIARLILVQHEAISDLARADRAAHALVGTPAGVAFLAGPERVVDSLVGLGFLRGHHGHIHARDAELRDGGGEVGFHGVFHCLLVCFRFYFFGDGFWIRELAVSIFLWI